MCIGSLLKSSMKSFEVRNIGKWSKIPQCILLFRKLFVLIRSIIAALLHGTDLFMTEIVFLK